MEIQSNFELPSFIKKQFPNDIHQLIQHTITQYTFYVLNVYQIDFSYRILYDLAINNYLFAFGIHHTDTHQTVLSVIEAQPFHNKMTNFYINLVKTDNITEFPLNIVRKMYIKCILQSYDCPYCSETKIFKINTYEYCLNQRCPNSIIRLDSFHLSFGDNELLLDSNDIFLQSLATNQTIIRKQYKNTKKIFNECRSKFSK